MHKSSPKSYEPEASPSVAFEHPMNPWGKQPRRLRWRYWIQPFVLLLLVLGRIGLDQFLWHDPQPMAARSGTSSIAPAPMAIGRIPAQFLRYDGSTIASDSEQGGGTYLLPEIRVQGDERIYSGQERLHF